VARRQNNKAFLTAVYNILLDRDPDPAGESTYLAALETGESRSHVISVIRSSPEALGRLYTEPGPALHQSRRIFVTSLPPARRILDLGGSSTVGADGALVQLGYPYRFEELVIVDLPPDDRHDLYATEIIDGVVATPLGPVRYRYHSMTELDRYPDNSFDLVYSGQTFEHVTPESGRRVLEGVRRVLRPGGFLALDTPNRRVTELHLAQIGGDFIDPDHEVEYRHDEMVDALEGAGLRVERAHGLNLCSDSVSRGRFDEAEIATRVGLFDRIEDCYLLAYVASKPA
jgi:SAM-dependent methyltransferase